MDDKIPLYTLDLSRENQNKNTRAMPNGQYWVFKEHINSGLTYRACFTSVNLASQSMQNVPFQLSVWYTKFDLQK